ncbi:hypothetical protein ACHAWC_008287 [Mediolabrus comicus]
MSRCRCSSSQSIFLEEYIARHPNNNNKSSSCHAFHEQLANFRSTIAKTTIKFATRLSTELSMISTTTMNDDDDLFKLPTPLLMSSSSSSSSSTNDYKDFASVVMGGEHLEHFHSYQKSSSVTTNGLSSGSNGRKEGDSSSSGGGMPTPTIKLHTDQGLFIAFTPGLIVAKSNNSKKKIMELSEGFYVQDSITGENVLLEFTQDDDLVFMLGDGVNDLINNQLLHQQKNKGGDDENETTKKMMVPPLLRATPHALSLSSYHDGDYDDASVARVWYGLMVLPPSDAYVPNTSNNKDNNNKMMTYGQLRQVFVESSSNGEDYPMGIGCSSRNSRMVINTSRSLAEGEGNGEEEEEGHGISNQCADNELFCWFRCQALDEETSTCEERNLGLQCVNPRMQVLPDGAGHGDYFPACTNNTHITHPVTDYPEIDQQDPDVCTVDQWDEFNVRDDYTHVVSLNPSFSKGLGPDARLSWTIVESDDGTKKVKARFAYDDVFGYLAIGFANIFDTVHNGMNGGKILLMKPGGDYSPVTGLDLSQAPSIGSYVIDDKDSAFRHWVDTEMVVDDATHEHTDCFTALTFESDNIGGQEFNLDGEGTDELIWAGNSKDYFVGYHGPFTRARFTINWLTGDVKFFVPDAPAWGEGSDEVEEEDGNHASSSEAVEDDGDLVAPQASDEVVEVGDLAASTVGTLDYSSASIAHASFGVTFAIICIVFL